MRYVRNYWPVAHFDTILTVCTMFLSAKIICFQLPPISSEKSKLVLLVYSFVFHQFGQNWHLQVTNDYKYRSSVYHPIVQMQIRSRISVQLWNTMRKKKINEYDQPKLLMLMWSEIVWCLSENDACLVLIVKVNGKSIEVGYLVNFLSIFYF